MTLKTVFLCLFFFCTVACAEADEFDGVALGTADRLNDRLVDFAEGVAPKIVLSKVRELHKAAPLLDVGAAQRAMAVFAAQFAKAFHSRRHADAFEVAVRAHAQAAKVKGNGFRDLWFGQAATGLIYGLGVAAIARAIIGSPPELVIGPAYAALFLGMYSKWKVDGAYPKVISYFWSEVGSMGVPIPLLPANRANWLARLAETQWRQCAFFLTDGLNTDRE